jgi:hypothetical protein
LFNLSFGFVEKPIADGIDLWVEGVDSCVNRIEQFDWVDLAFGDQLG